MGTLPAWPELVLVEIFFLLVRGKDEDMGNRDRGVPFWLWRGESAPACIPSDRENTRRESDQAQGEEEDESTVFPGKVREASMMARPGETSLNEVKVLLDC